MVKESSLMVKICSWVEKYSIYALLFLMPIFFLPWTADVLDFNKQTILILLGFLSLFSWMIRSLVVGKVELNINKIHIVVGVLFLISFLATVFSINASGSFWGWPSSDSESFLTLIGVVILYFLISNTFSKQNIISAIFVLLISLLIAEIIGIFQLLGLFIIPLKFTKSVAFNTVGSIGSLGFLIAILLPVIIMMIVVSKRQWRVLFWVQLFLSALIIFIINYAIVWWVVLAGSIVLMIFGTIKRDLFDGRWISLPVFFMAVALFFILLNPQIAWLSSGTNEIFISQNASLSISLQAVKERPIFGSGPGMFSYDFLKFKDDSFSQGYLWDAVFGQASSKVLNDLTTTGILGLIATLALIAWPLFNGFKFLFQERKSTGESHREAIKVYWILTLSVCSALVSQALMYFFYNPSLVLVFLNFFLIAILVVFTSYEKEKYELKPSSLMTLVITFIFTLIFIFGFGLLILNGQRYVSVVRHYNGLESWHAGNKEEGIKNLEIAASLNSSSDLYFKQLSQAYLALLQEKMNQTKSTPTDEEKNKMQVLIANSINSAVVSTNINPKNANNWINRGYIYQSLNGIIGDTSNFALESYDQALKLDPKNPYILTQQGATNYILASSLGSDQVEQKNSLMKLSKEKLERAVKLNHNYSNGLYMLGLVYDALGQKDKAVEQFNKVKQLNPKDANVDKILSNLNSGLPALQAPVEISPPSDSSSIQK